MIDGFMADGAWSRRPGEVHRQATGDLLRAPGVCLIAGPSVVRADGFSRTRPGREQEPPLGATTTPANRSSDIGSWNSRVARAQASPRFGRRAARSACHCAVVARYSRPPLRVAGVAPQLSGDCQMPLARADEQPPCMLSNPGTRRSAISSRSRKREIPTREVSPIAPNIDGGMPLPSWNHRVPTFACGTPWTPTAASSLAVPAAIAKPARSPPAPSRPATGGRPGENNRAHPPRTIRAPFSDMFIATPVKVLRRPLESAQYAAQGYREGSCLRHGLVGLDGQTTATLGYDNPKAESFMAKTLKVEAVYPMAYETFADVANDLPRDSIDKALQRSSSPLSAGLSQPEASSRISIPGLWSNQPPDSCPPQGAPLQSRGSKFDAD